MPKKTNNIRLCADCYYCKQKKQIIRCIQGKFEGKSLKEIRMYTPIDHECKFHSEMKDE